MRWSIVISCVEVLNLIHTCFECTNSLYMYIQRLVAELNSYELMVFIAEICFVTISCSVPHISPLLIWSIWHKISLVIISYMMSTRIHLYFHSLYDICGVDSVTNILGRSICHSHPVCVPICAYVILSAHVNHRY